MEREALSPWLSIARTNSGVTRTRAGGWLRPVKLCAGV